MWLSLPFSQAQMTTTRTGGLSSRLKLPKYNSPNHDNDFSVALLSPARWDDNLTTRYENVHDEQRQWSTQVRIAVVDEKESDLVIFRNFAVNYHMRYYIFLLIWR
jgi:hypothetical protein